MNWYLGCWKKYAEFSGRARRKEFWMFFLFNFLAFFALAIVDVVLGTSSALCGLYSLATIIPGLAVIVRRLHDTDHSGWWPYPPDRLHCSSRLPLQRFQAGREPLRAEPEGGVICRR